MSGAGGEVGSREGGLGEGIPVTRVSNGQGGWAD